MISCLLVEGPSYSGKSTSIIETLGINVKKAGGFLTCRMEGPNQEIQGFYQCKPEYFIALNEPIRREYENVFLKLRPGASETCRPVWDESVLRTFTLQRVLRNLEYPFFILDEIGGLELMLPEFSEALLGLVNSGRPMVGVWKSPENSERMALNLHLGDSYAKIYQRVRRELLGNPLVTLTKIEEGGGAAWKKALSTWCDTYVE